MMEIYGINSYKNKRALVGAPHQINFHQNKSEFEIISGMILVLLYLVG